VAGFTLAPGLEAKVARMVTPAVVEIAREVERDAKELAPATKDWVSMRDARVRHTHVQADDDNNTDTRGIPDNLRFAIKSMQWDREHRGLGPMTYLRFPGDESSRAYVNLIHCRCRAEIDPDGIAKLISTEQPVVGRHEVTVKVVCEGNWVVASEFGTVYPGNLIAEPARFMGRAASQVAARRRARR